VKKYIIGLSAFYHDSSACLLEDDKILCAFQEERFTRKKFDSSFPNNSIKNCLSYASLNINQIDCIAFYENPDLKLDRIIKTFLRYDSLALKNSKDLVEWYSNKFFIEKIIRDQLDYKNDFIFFNHHESHAASAFYPSPFKNAGILTLDGVGEWNTSTHSIGKDSKISIVKEENFPNSLGLFYSSFTNFCGFKVLSGEYKLMGLAPYGEPKYANVIKDNLISINEDGSIKLNLKYFEFHKYKKMINKNFEDLFKLKIRQKNENMNLKYLDIAASVQQVVEEVVIKNVNSLIKNYQIENLCLSGGVALNCVANGKIDQQTDIKKIWIQPAAGDAGSSIGAAYLALYKKYDYARIADNTNDKQQGSYLGHAFKDNEIKDLLDSLGFHYKEFNSKDIWTESIVNYLVDSQVIGYFEGRMEFGPRALGSRSIIANPTDPEMQKKLNLKIKFRESFRPFAPLVLEEYANEWFDIKNKNNYMLMTYFLKNEKKIFHSKVKGLDKIKKLYSSVPAVTHVDYSARAQILDQKYKEKLHGILSLFNKKTKIPMIINTSFNIRGEPIVNTPYDALKCFMNTNMDILVLENFILIKKSQQKDLLVDSKYRELSDSD
tara:strand:- start:9804 stop:11618 length:1815 start_codon:yes stop_codon:yes gene_type:complete